jgi:antitoxin component YwqK of YwqJK toxin-antitoxin module
MWQKDEMVTLRLLQFGMKCYTFKNNFDGMKNFFLPVLLVSLHTFAQTDTSYIYLDRFGIETNKETAVYLSKIYKSEELWKKNDYWVNTDSLYKETSFLDKERKKRHGIWKDYYRSGGLKDSILFDNGKKKAVWYFFENGKKESYASFNDNGKVNEQMGWDEAENELKDFVVEKEAEFPGGMEGWKSYLERNLNANVAAMDKAPVGYYTVKVQFIIDKEGNVSNVKAISIPALCPSCGKEAERIIRKGPKWTSAMQNGKQVIYQAIQYITFSVAQW